MTPPRGVTPLFLDRFSRDVLPRCGEKYPRQANGGESAARLKFEADYNVPYDLPRALQPLALQSQFWGQTIIIPTGLFPKRVKKGLRNCMVRNLNST